MVLAIGHLFNMFIPWVSQFLFGRVVKTAGNKALTKALIDLKPPNLLLVGILVLGINGINFLVNLLFSGSTAVPIISTTVISLVTAGFLLKGFLFKRTMKESIVLLAVLAVIYALFIASLAVFGVTWVALSAKLILEVILGFAVMLSEVHILVTAQSKAANKVIERLGINPGGLIGKYITKLADDSEGANPKRMQSSDTHCAQ